MKERWEEEMRCLREQKYNRRIEMNRQSSAMQQCKKCNAFNGDYLKYRIPRVFTAFRRLFYSRKMPKEAIHIIVIHHFRDADRQA
ncbi:hypothetical protein [Rhizobium sp. ICMP 5592]|uniref:hypothetical protein n=1 Tax=Rhizobium sp. ICMP 5592 TaxID=2292445 RepID=UPI0018867DA8|nr:hypothetical protein [Rhizobium sp. ICMP 5592]